MKVIQNKINKSIIILPIFGIIILSFLYINIYVGNALMNSSAVTGDYELSVQNNTTLRIELPTTTPISVTPTVAGQFNSQTLPVNVVSDYVNGYTLTMSASTSSLSRSEAVNGKTYEIPTLTSNTDESNNPYTCTAETSETCNFPKDTWGYKRTTAQVSDDGYRALVANTNVPINITSGPANESISNIDFGVKLSNATPNGTYNITLNFLAVTNISPNLYYMQDATSTSLAAAMPNIGDTTVLYDRRDNKEYTIAKLADGKYWMTKNLDLDGGTPLYSSDSDVPAGYDVEPYYTLPESSIEFQYPGGVYNSGATDCETSPGCYSYYTFAAATASNRVDNTHVNSFLNSICPKNWKLPESKPTSDGRSDFRELLVGFGGDSLTETYNQDTTPTGEALYNQLMSGLMQMVTGYYVGGNEEYMPYGKAAYLWSSTNSATGNVSYALNVSDYSGISTYVGSNSELWAGMMLPVRCLFDATMQNFTSEDADAMALHQEEILVDARDGKNYYVTKLKDGNVWMTQNLDLDLDSNVALTSANTDLNSVDSWTPARSTINSTAYNNTASGASGGILTYNGSNSHNDSFASGWTNDTNTPYSADPGYRYVVPKEMSSSNTNWYDNGDTFYYCVNQDTTCGGNSENGHYTMGNFYNFAAANATNNVETTVGGSANVVQDKVMPDSICPKGWRLPIDKTTNNEFSTLLGASNYNVISNFNFAGLDTIRIAPLYFVRSGHVTGGTLGSAGVAGHAWSSTISSSTNGYYLGFHSTEIDPASNDNRLYGFPVRCLLRTE